MSWVWGRPTKETTILTDGIDILLLFQKYNDIPYLPHGKYSSCTTITVIVIFANYEVSNSMKFVFVNQQLLLTCFYNNSILV